MSRRRKSAASRVLWAGALLGLAGATAAVVWLSSVRGRIRPKPSPNVLLVTIDTLRADHVGLYREGAQTPRLDALGNAGVVFDHAVAQAPITLPSHASLFTSMYPFAHGVRDNGSFHLSRDRRTLTESFHAAGYRTAAFVGSFALDSRFGLDRGFELYDDFYGDASALNDFAFSERPADGVLEPALEWLSARGEEPWFVFVHLYDPHAPYAPPAPFYGRFRDDLYRGEVAYADDALGALFDGLEARGQLSNTIVVVTSDHGEGLGEHGERTHGMFAYETTLHVPLILAWDGVVPPRRVGERVRLIDVAPTILELAGIAPLPASQGSSLVPLLEGRDSPLDGESYFESLAFNLNRGFAPLTGIYRGDFKYIDLPIPEIYDLRSDPGETKNLVGARAALAKEMAARLAELREAFPGGDAAGRSRRGVDEETRRRLEALGYATGPGALAPKSSYGEEDDPKRLIRLSDRLDDAMTAHLAGRTEEAIRLLRAIVRERPSMAKAYDSLSYVLREAGRLAEATGVLETSLERGASTIAMRARLGLYLQEAGRTEDSVDLLEAVVAEEPTYAEAYNYLGVAHAQAGRTEEAIRVFHRLIELDSSYASAYSNLGSAYLSVDRRAEAEAEFRRALQIDPRLAAAWNGLGVVEAGTGREEQAVESWKRCLELDPRQYDTLYNLGTLLTTLDRFSEALSYLERFVETAPRERYHQDIQNVRRLIAAIEATL